MARADVVAIAERGAGAGTAVTRGAPQEFVYADLRLSPNIEFGQYLQPAQGAVGAGDKVVAPQIGGRVEEAVSFLQCDLIVRVHRELFQVTLDSGQFRRLQQPADRVSLPGEILIADALGHFQV